MSTPNTIRQSTFANLPAASTESGLSWIITDANSVSNPTAGGTPGNLALVYSNGTSWLPAPLALNPVTTLTSTTTIAASYLPQTFILDATGGTFTVPLPSSPLNGQIVKFSKKDNVNAVAISAAVPISIFGLLIYLTTQDQSISVQYDNTNTQWVIF